MITSCLPGSEISFNRSCTDHAARSMVLLSAHASTHSWSSHPHCQQFPQMAVVVHNKVCRIKPPAWPRDAVARHGMRRVRAGQPLHDRNVRGWRAPRAGYPVCPGAPAAALDCAPVAADCTAGRVTQTFPCGSVSLMTFTTSSSSTYRSRMRPRSNSSSTLTKNTC